MKTSLDDNLDINLRDKYLLFWFKVFLQITRVRPFELTFIY